MALTLEEKKVIEGSALERFKREFPGARGGSVLSRLPFFICHIADGQVKKIEFNRFDYENKIEAIFY